MDLFDTLDYSQKLAPLADRMRPTTLDEFFGQKHLLYDGSLLKRAIKADKLGSCIFFGPPGVGKTTLAGIVASSTNAHFVKLNAVSSGVADAKKVIDEARERLRVYGKRTYLLLDECHRWNKAQSDCVLSAIEDGSIIFIGSTTENPYLSMTRAIVSRCRVFELKSLSEQDVMDGLFRAATDKERGLGNMNVKLDEDAVRHLAYCSGGDMRNALNALELAALTTPPVNGVICIDKSVAEQSIQRKAISVDESKYFDMLSAFCKSLRGSDADAALYWAFMLIEAGLDPLIIFRRMIAHSSEDVGLANSNALIMTVAAMTAYERIGMPEGALPLAHAIIYICASPKSNSVVTAMNATQSVCKNMPDLNVPSHLRNNNNSSLDRRKPYKYPHDYGGYVKQQYLPDSLVGSVFYCPKDEGNEARIKQFMEKIKGIL